MQTAEVDRVKDRWDLKTELIAQLLEVTSVGIAERKLKKPLEVPRPEHLSRKRKGKNTDGGVKGAIGLLAATARSR